MANSITKFKAYIDKLDTVYQQASATSILDADADTVRTGAKAGEFLIPKMSMDGLADYSRSSGYVKGDVTITYETKSCNYDRGRKFSVDAMDNEETAGIAFGKLASEFIRTKVVPEMDAFRFAKYASATGILSAAEATPTAGTAVLTALQTAVNAQDEAEVNVDGKILYITPTLLTLAKNVDTTKSKAILDRFEKIITVPQTRFYTAIDMKDVTSSNETAGGYAGATGGYKINFMIINHDAVIQFGKHTVNKVVSPEENQTDDGYMFFYRAYSIAETYENKVKGIYLNRDTTALT
ncbi:MAG: hypothetical protein HP018_01370 [Ruminiclostridium sp.]|nr:hypothetical protein [Ruminiclostridium sp.]